MVPIVLLAVAVGVAVWLGRRARGTVAAPAAVGALGWAPGTRWAVVRPLARAEARRLARHPAFVVGVVLTPLMLGGATGSETSWRSVSGAMALALVPLGWATIIAANLLANRPRRTGTDELFAAAPVPQPVRSTGLMLSASVAVAAASVLALGWALYLSQGSTALSGSPRPVETAAGVLIVAGSVVVGVGVARWLPGVGFGILAAFATAVIQARFFEVQTWPWYRSEADPIRFLGFLADPTSVNVAALEIRPAGWHLVYLGGLVLVMAAVALARDGVPRRLFVGLAVTVAVTAAAGWAQVRPPTDRQVAAMVAYLTDPESQQTCTVEGPVRYCASGDNLDLVDDWRRSVEAVRALLPVPVAGRSLAVVERVPTIVGNSNCSPQPFFEGLLPGLVERLAPGEVWPDDGAVHPGTDRFPCGGRRVHGFFTAVQVGSWAVGLPPSPHGLDERCTARGEARSAVALWLGAAASPQGARNLRALVDEPPSADGLMSFSGWTDPPMWGVAFAITDAELALRMLAVPATQVTDALAGRWETVVAPGATSHELAELVGVAAAPAGVTATPGARVCP